MRKHFLILTLLCITTSIFAESLCTCRDTASFPDQERILKQKQVDSIMRLVIDKAMLYKNIISNYDAEIYIKGRTEILKQNPLIRFAHHIFPVDRKNKDMLFEMVSQSKYQAPNTYVHNFKAINGNSIPNEKKQMEACSFLNLNVYSPTAYNDAIFMPISKDAFRLYTFKLDSIIPHAYFNIYQIRFLPKQWSQKLVCGHLYINDKTYTIDQIDMHGRYSFAEFNLSMKFGRNFQRFILPEKADLYLRYKLLGNTVETRYHSSFKYQEIEWFEKAIDEKERNTLDMTEYYRLSSDTVPIIRDSTFWARHRDIPLTKNERELYSRKTIRQANPSDTVWENSKYIKLTEQLVNSRNMYFKSTRIRYSGILNPFQLGYSARNGITYRQKIRISKTFDKDKQLRFHPQIGYVFKRKQLFFKLGGEWEYLPQRLGTISLEVGNSNESYSSEITNKINEQLKDSTFKFDDLELEYFKHYYAEIRHSIELFNGFQLSTALSYHHRIPSQKNKRPVGDQVEAILNKKYNDFTPTIGISYTPRQYYRMDGYRKEYVYSHYPTIAIEYARGIPGVGNSTGNYARVEADIHQSIQLGLCRRLNYHISGGLFTHQKSIYFADFRYFTRRNFPDSWNDQIGGVFNLLRGVWFNAADKYLQAHFMYESPFVLFRLMRINSSQKFMQIISRYIFSERFYFSQLWTPALPSYTEIGYGIGNHIFNVGIFAGFDRWNYQSIGFKFAFELFQ